MEAVTALTGHEWGLVVRPWTGLRIWEWIVPSTLRKDTTDCARSFTHNVSFSLSQHIYKAFFESSCFSPLIPSFFHCVIK